MENEGETAKAGTGDLEQKVAEALVRMRSSPMVIASLGITQTEYENVVTKPTFGRLYAKLAMAHSFLPSLPKILEALSKKAETGTMGAAKLAVELMKLVARADTDEDYFKLDDTELRSLFIQLLPHAADIVGVSNRELGKFISGSEQRPA